MGVMCTTDSLMRFCLQRLAEPRKRDMEELIIILTFKGMNVNVVVIV